MNETMKAAPRSTHAHSGDCGCSKCKPVDKRNTGETVEFGPWTLPKDEVHAVDVLMRYSESQSDPRSGLGRGGCSGTAACEYTRTHESYQLYCEPAENCDDPSI